MQQRLLILTSTHRHVYKIVPSKHVLVSFASWEKSWHLNIILLTCKLSAANSIARVCIRKGKKKRRVNLKPITVWCILSLNKIKTKFNELSSSSTVTFPLPILHLLQPSFTLPPFLFIPATACLSSTLPHLVFHFKPTTLPPSSSLSIQNNGHSRKRAINLLQWDQSARECQGYSRLLSLLTSTQHWITYRRRERANGESGRVESESKKPS